MGLIKKDFFPQFFASRRAFTVFLLLWLLIVSSCGKKVTEPLDYEPDSELDSEITDQNGNNRDFIPEDCREGQNAFSQQVYRDFIESHGGYWIDPADYAMTLEDFDRYLKQSGIVHFSSYEFLLPGTPDYARACGYDVLLPERGCWSKAATLALFLEEIRAENGHKPIKVTSWWRPKCYNQSVGGARGSDHISASAVDITFKERNQRMNAQSFLCQHYWNFTENSFTMRIGLGDKAMHIGLYSHNRRAFWYYPTYTRPTDEYAPFCW